jgi:hypothetical protein
LIADSTYLIIEKLNFHGGVSGAINIAGMYTHHVAIRYSSIKNREFVSNTSGIGMQTDFGGAMHDFVVYKNKFEALGDWTAIDPSGQTDFHGINPNLWDRDSTTSLYNIWILENTCLNLMGDCIHTNAGNWPNSWDYLHHVYIGKNVCGPGRQVGIGTKQASDVIVSQNITYGDRVNGTGFGGITSTHPKKNYWVIFNRIYGSNYGFRQADTNDPSHAGDPIEGEQIYLVGNIIYDIRPEIDDYEPGDDWEGGVGIALWHGRLNRYIVDNTIYDTYTALTANYAGGVEMSGNIIAEIDNNQYQYLTEVLHPARHELTAFDYNLYYDADNIRFRGYYPGVFEFSYSLEEWKTAVATRTFTDKMLETEGHCYYCKVGDPMFLDPENGDFRLKAGSPAIGANQKHPVYDRFKELYGLDIYVDFNGNPRPETNSTMGALEYAPPPPPPPGLPPLLVW